MARVSYLVFFILSHLFLLSLAQEEWIFNTLCQSFSCGILRNIKFPVTNKTHPGCGLLTVDNCDQPVQRIQLGNEGPWFNITNISQDNTITLKDQDFQDHLNHRRCESFENFTLPAYPFLSFEITSNLTLYKCTHKLDNKLSKFSLSCKDSFIYYNHPDDDSPSLPPSQCSLIQLPVNTTGNTTDLFKLLTGNFSLKLHRHRLARRECNDCHSREGQCLINSQGNLRCENERTGIKYYRKKNLKLKLVLGASGSSICILIIIAFCFRKKISSYNTMIFWKKTTENYRNIEDFLRNYGSLAPKRYSYADIKKMTSSFKHKLGQGGYGGVYKGKLHNGRNVAVKVLNESKGNGEDFTNEVASISRTSHINIVTLVGFCFEGQRKALIYEFVPNGSLEKFIYENNPLETDNKLKWQTLYEIAVGIARGLEYLHRGCSTRILHFDIKPHNILLDEDFCPKISDFGLAKICPRKESIVSMTGTRGTVGYIAPEVFCRNFGDVSHKSDVYSYGMLIFEMTGRKNKNVGVNRSSDVYFPDWIYKSLETDEELLLQGIENDEDKECARKMIMVSLWCIQTNPSDRPAMNRVVEMLEGSHDSLQIPPKPFLSSPGSQPGSSTILECQTESSLMNSSPLPFDPFFMCCAK